MSKPLSDEVKAKHLSRWVRLAIGPEIFKHRYLLCASHSGKGTGLECSDCCHDLAEERDKLLRVSIDLRAELERVAEELANWLGYSRFGTQPGRWHLRKDAEMSMSLASVRAVLAKGDSDE